MIGVIGIWASIVVVAIAGMGIAIELISLATGKRRCGENIVGCIIGAIASILIALAICFGLHWYLYNTESGSRAMKDWNSDVNGGIERTVTVYDMEGDVLAVYNGRFDVESSDTKIKFDDEDGKRHIVYFTTGTVTIDEN